MAKSEPIEIEFDFEIVQVKSMADGSPRVVIGLSEDDMPKAMLLWDAKLRGEIPHANVTLIPVVKAEYGGRLK